MSKGTKIGCAIAAAVVILAALVCAGGVFFAKDYFGGIVDEYRERAPQMKAEAEVVAAGGAEACVSDGLSRIATCGPVGIKCRVEGTIRTNLCLKVAETPPEFCTDVPAPTSIIDVSIWGVEECERRGLGGDDQCAQFMAKTIAPHCDRLAGG